MPPNPGVPSSGAPFVPHMTFWDKVGARITDFDLAMHRATKEVTSNASSFATKLSNALNPLVNVADQSASIVQNIGYMLYGAGVNEAGTVIEAGDSVRSGIQSAREADVEYRRWIESLDAPSVNQVLFSTDPRDQGLVTRGKRQYEYDRARRSGKAAQNELANRGRSSRRVTPGSRSVSGRTLYGTLN